MSIVPGKLDQDPTSLEAAPSLPGLEAALERACGVTLAAGARPALGEAVRRAARHLGLASEPFLSRLHDGEPAAMTALVEHAVVQETYFYRHPEQLEAMARRLSALPPGRPISAWSAGCATGEEAYTLAMVLRDLGRLDGADRVLGTDVSRRGLEVGRVGRYREWSLRQLPAVLRARHFTAEPGSVRVIDPVRAQVRFAHHNLLGPAPAGGPFDLVVCRNVLLYFRPEMARALLARLHAALRPGGLLLVGPVEEPLAAGLPFERLDEPGSGLLRRPLGARERSRGVGAP
jgi:chemotaxis protein methyltransferase CheR